MGGQHQAMEYISQEDLSHGLQSDSTASQPHPLKLNILAKLMRSNRSSRLLSFCWNSAYPSSTRLSSCMQITPHHSPLPTNPRHALNQVILTQRCTFNEKRWRQDWWTSHTLHHKITRQTVSQNH